MGDRVPPTQDPDPATRRSGALASPLGRRAAKAVAGDGDLRDMRAAAWHRQGIVVLRPDEICDEWTRQAICAERYAALLQRLSRIEWIMLSVAGALIAALAAALWRAAPLIARIGA